MSKPIERKLRTELCPYLVTSRYLHRWGPYRVYTLYSYFGELCLLLAGIGLSNPVLAFLRGDNNGAETATASDSPTVIEYLSDNPFGWWALGALVFWGMLKVYVRKEDLERRCTLISSYRRQCLQIESSVLKALVKPDPMPDLIESQRKLSDLVDRNIAEGSIPHLGILESLGDVADAYCKRLVADHSGCWDPAPAADQRPVTH